MFFISASQTELLTKWPIWATSFHSDWPNWDLLTESPIRAGTGQSAVGICHPRHSGLPPRINALSVSVTLMTFSYYERFNCLQNLLYWELNVKNVWPHIDIEFQKVYKSFFIEKKIMNRLLVQNQCDSGNIHKTWYTGIFNNYNVTYQLYLSLKQVHISIFEILRCFINDRSIRLRCMVHFSNNYVINNKSKNNFIHWKKKKGWHSWDEDF